MQIFGDDKGGGVALGERDCSLQRRNQKVIEETPAPGLSDEDRAALREAAISLGKAVSYESAGTVEFVYDADQQQFYFLEVNTRLQVEHCVTEAIFGVDLTEWMVRQAAGEFTLPAHASLTLKGAAIEARVYAEDPSKDFRPSTGLLTRVKFAEGVRVDGWIETGVEVSPYYDPLLAKVIAYGETRDNYPAHKHPKVRQWLDRHGRFTFHFTPTSCSWLTAVEGFFAKLTKRRLKRGVFRSIVDLRAAINRFRIDQPIEGVERRCRNRRSYLRKEVTPDRYDCGDAAIRITSCETRGSVRGCVPVHEISLGLHEPTIQFDDPGRIHRRAQAEPAARCEQRRRGDHAGGDSIVWQIHQQVADM